MNLELGTKYIKELNGQQVSLALLQNPLQVAVLGVFGGPVLVDGGDERLFGASHHVIDHPASGGPCCLRLDHSRCSMNE